MQLRSSGRPSPTVCQLQAQSLCSPWHPDIQNYKKHEQIKPLKLITTTGTSNVLIDYQIIPFSVKDYLLCVRKCQYLNVISEVKIQDS